MARMYVHTYVSASACGKVESFPHPSLRDTFSRQREKGKAGLASGGKDAAKDRTRLRSCFPRLRGKMPRRGRRGLLLILILILILVA